MFYWILSVWLSTILISLISLFITVFILIRKFKKEYSNREISIPDKGKKELKIQFRLFIPIINLIYAYNIISRHKMIYELMIDFSKEKYSMYFVTSDIHSFYSIFKKELDNKGFDINNPEHKLIICGDAFDRGSEAKALLNFLSSIPEDRLLLVRGNHEDLLEDCLLQLAQHTNISNHHWTNGTLDTIAQLSDTNKYDLICGLFDYKKIKNSLKNYFKLISRAKDYIEIKDYIFVHGWIPVNLDNYLYIYNPNWRNASKEDWNKARWFNGMDMAHNGIIEPNKTIICGHWHCSYGHYEYHNEGKDAYSIFTPYKDKGIIAIDACTAYSHKCNILVLEEN